MKLCSLSVVDGSIDHGSALMVIMALPIGRFAEKNPRSGELQIIFLSRDTI